MAITIDPSWKRVDNRSLGTINEKNWDTIFSLTDSSHRTSSTLLMVVAEILDSRVLLGSFLSEGMSSSSSSSFSPWLSGIVNNITSTHSKGDNSLRDFAPKCSHNKRTHNQLFLSWLTLSLIYQYIPTKWIEFEIFKPNNKKKSHGFKIYRFISKPSRVFANHEET